jgi:hypothetical protein
MTWVSRLDCLVPLEVRDAMRMQVKRFENINNKYRPSTRTAWLCSNPVSWCEGASASWELIFFVQFYNGTTLEFNCPKREHRVRPYAQQAEPAADVSVPNSQSISFLVIRRN